MNIALILAGGTGKRMGATDKPKQYLKIGDKPIIIHTIEKFLINSKIDEIIVLCPEDWVTYTQKLIEKYIDDTKKISVTVGGETRNETILNGIKNIEEKHGIDESTIVITHDAVRPFVTHRIIEENIKVAEEGMACDTVFPASDTIVESENGEDISFIPERAKCYLGQTPQTFNANKFKELYSNMSEKDKLVLTDAAKVFVNSGEKVKLVKGENFNIKVTYAYDLEFAETLIRGNK